MKGTVVGWWPCREATWEESCPPTGNQVDKWKDCDSNERVQLRLDVLNCTFTDLNENALKGSTGLNAVFFFFFFHGETISSPAIKRDKSLKKTP